MAGELIRPGVQVIQTFRNPSPSFVRPTLVPCVVGPAFEVINVLNTDGTLNSRARYGAYSQLAKAITESSFPDHRGNIDELDILEESVRPFMLAGGTLSELPMDPGEAFLATSHGAAAAAIRTDVFNGGTGLALAGKVLTLAIDQTVRLDSSADITVTFSGTGNLSAQDCADQINEAVGQEVASVVGTAPSDRVQIRSLNYGAMSSVTVRAGGSANVLLGLSTAGNEERVEGSGFRAQDDNDNDTMSPWIEFHRGDYQVNGVSGAFDPQAGLINIEGQSFVSGQAAAVTFGAAGSMPIEVGDFMFADGVRVKSGEVMKVELARFKIGTINTVLSVADDNGKYISKVYDAVEVDTLFSDAPFAPGHVWFKANGIDWKKVAPVAASVLSGQAGAAASAAQVTGSGAGAGPFALAGLKLRYVVEVDGVETEGSFTFAGGPFANMAAVVAAIGTSIPGVTALDNSGQLRLQTTKTGRLQAVTVKATGTANTDLGFSTSTDTTDRGSDVEFAGLNGKELQIKFDDNPHVYSVVFSANSLDLAVDEINSVVGAVVASKGGTSLDKLKLTSTLKGVASKVTVLPLSPAGAEDLFKLESTDVPAPTVVAGSGRPMPDAYLDDANVLHVQSQILRDQVKGFPLDPALNSGTLFIQFKGLRKDVSASAKVAGVLRLADVDTLTQVLDPITEDNPLALGLFLTMINAPTFEVKGLGIDEVTAAAPEGTSSAWARAAGMLEAEEVYALAPLSQDEVVHGIFNTHCSVMSEPEQGGERIVFENKKMPTRKNPKLVLSGTQANSTASSNQLLLDANPAGSMVENGLNPGLPIPESAELYVELEVAGEVRRYSVSSVSGALVSLRTSFSAGVNVDAFYSTVLLDESVVNAPYVMKIRGVSLVIPGSNPERLDYGLVAETVAEANAGIKNRRVYSVFPDTVKTTVQGLDKTLPGYYACAAIAGMVAAQPPQQGFTNFPITGITGVSGTEKFSKRQLNIMAGGGTYVLIQDVVGGPVSSRHQLSTDLTSIETRELSITKCVDFVAKFLRLGVRKYIGTQVINQQLLDTIGSTVHAMLKFLEEAGVLNGSNLNNIAQDASQPDTVLVDVTLEVPYPCNYIRLTLVV